MRLTWSGVSYLIFASHNLVSSSKCFRKPSPDRTLCGIDTNSTCISHQQCSKFIGCCSFGCRCFVNENPSLATKFSRTAKALQGLNIGEFTPDEENSAEKTPKKGALEDDFLLEWGWLGGCFD